VSEQLVAIIGNDPIIVGDTAVTVIDQMLEGLDAAIALEDFAAGASSDPETATAPVAMRVLEALNTPPFLVSHRVVVLRDIQNLAASDVEPLLEWAASPTPGVRLLVTALGARSRSALVKAAGEVHDVTVSAKAKDRVEFVAERFHAHKVHAPAGVCQKVAERLGDEVSRVDALARTLQAVYGEDPLTIEMVDPYLGDAGDVPEWDLTDAIDQGHVADAIATARRMLDSEGRVGVQVVNILQRHYLKMARLEGSGATTGEQAAEIIGGHAFPAQKLVRSARLLGPDRVAAAISMVTRADLDLKGGADYGSSRGGVDRTALTVIEVLVARLARLSVDARTRG
jgi:DNA polymerase-3 subunit delta